MIARLPTAMIVHNVAESWLLEDIAANGVMESVNEFRSIIVLAAKD